MIAQALHVPENLGLEDADYARALAYIDGAFVPYLDAKISVRDFGFSHADVTYDVVHTWRGGFFRLDDHLDRFERSLKGFRLDPGLTRGEMTAILHELVRRTGLRETLVYFACTRGAPPLGGRDPADCVNTFLAHAQPLILRGSPGQMRKGLSMMISEEVHRISARSVDPTMKNVHWGDFTRALFMAKDAGFDTVVLTGQDGNVTEGPGFNVMAVMDGALVTPDAGVLEGVSRRTMMELAGFAGIPARYAAVSPGALRDADEVFITSTSCGLFPVTRVDDRILGNGAPGPLTTRLLNLYYQKKNEGWMMTPVPGL